MYQLPQALTDSLKTVEGFNEEAFIKLHNAQDVITSLRINPLKINELPTAYSGHKVPWSAYGYYLSERPIFTLDPLLHAGAYYVQEAASQFLWHILAQLFKLEKKHTVLDLCAAPGGKSSLLSSFFSQGIVVANEVIKSRCAILEENMIKWGAANTVVTNNDPKDFNCLPGFFDLMVIDAPCSGSGLFRKDNNAIEEWSVANVELCSKRQQRILHDAYQTLKQDGYLVYSTCSYSQEENEYIVDYILQNFNVETIQLTINAEWNIIETQSQNHKGFGYRFFPHKVKSEGFFVSVFKKKDGTSYTDNPSAGRKKFFLKEKEEIKKWMQNAEDFSFIKIGEKILAFKSADIEKISTLKQHLYLKKAGIEIGEIKNKGLVPAHSFALSGLVNDTINRLELNKEKALRYLRKQDIEIETPIQGWTLITYQQIPLGWVKILPNRINNYYPVEWRILMQ